MKILNLSFADSAGAAFTLSHALNKCPGVTAVNMRANNNYINYPSMLEMRSFDKSGCQKIVESADVIVFHTAVQPFFTALDLVPEVLQTKKLLLYFHGTDIRNYGADIMKQADELLGEHVVLLSTPDLYRWAPHGQWMPICRSFTEIKARYGRSKRDDAAVKAFGQPVQRLSLTHAPTNVALKGSALFMKVITSVLEHFPGAQYTPIRNMSWDSCLRTMSMSDIYFDQNVLGAYGASAVEASIFKVPVFCSLDEGVAEIMELVSGMKNPYIQWSDEEDMKVKILRLLTSPKGRRTFGNRVHAYNKKMHDENPITKRFLKIVDEMPTENVLIKA